MGSKLGKWSLKRQKHVQHKSQSVGELLLFYSWFILAVSLTEVPLWNAIIMNLTGILFFYIHERVWNNVDFGRYSEKSK